MGPLSVCYWPPTRSPLASKFRDSWSELTKDYILAWRMGLSARTQIIAYPSRIIHDVCIACNCNIDLDQFGGSRLTGAVNKLVVASDGECECTALHTQRLAERSRGRGAFRKRGGRGQKEHGWVDVGVH